MKYISLSLFIMALIALIGAGCANEANNTAARNSNQAPEKIPDSLFSFKEISYDFGVIKQSGGKIQHDFLFTYNGAEPIAITGTPTSCACASASADKTQLAPGDSGIITVTFNPNLHAEPKGKFFKTVSLLTEPALEEIPEIKIWTEIDLDLGPDAFELQPAEHDHDDEVET